ncbi:hypothetical protein [Gimesia algae]|uniref:Chromosome partition protein Smc n=1 Tax=Gimesia algae TaxID=2527971 RepID=A0A517VBP4_9PLAN|nr:hypothetical protein [Gimesia algae]QDT90427.1 Chromosome partition protein Smc [Gimesia algae]
MNGLPARRFQFLCLQTVAVLCCTSLLSAADNPADKTAASESPLQAVKPILNHGPTQLPTALKFAELDAAKASKITEAQVKAVNQITAELKQADSEISKIQSEIQKAKQKIKTETDALKMLQEELKALPEKKSGQQKVEDQNDELAEAAKLKVETLSLELKKLEQQVKLLEQSLPEKQKQQAELKKQVAVADKNLTEQRTQAGQFQEFVELFRKQPPVADPKRFREVAAFSHSRPLYSCKIDASGNYMLAGAQGSAFNRWDLVSAENTELLGHQSWIRRFDVGRSDPLLITGAYEGKIAWWDLEAEQPKPQHLVAAHQGYVRGVTISPDGTLVATGGNDCLVKLWSVKTAKLVRTLEGHEYQVYNVKFHPSGRWLISGDLRGNLKQWDVETGDLVRDFDGSAIYKYDTTFHGHIGGVRGMDISRDGKYFAISGIGEVSNAFAGIGVPTVILFDWATGKRLAVMTPDDNFKGTCWGVRFHPENDFIAAAGGNSSGMIWFWKLGEDKPFASEKVKSVPYDLDFHPDGLRMCVACFDKTARLYHLGPETPSELAARKKDKVKKK